MDRLDEPFVDYDFPNRFEVTDTIEELVTKYNSLYEIAEQHVKICEAKAKEADIKRSKEFESVLKKLENDGLIKIDEINFKTDDLRFKVFELDSIPNFDERFEKDFKKFFELDDEKDYFFNTQLVDTELMILARSLKLFVEEDSYEVSAKCVQSLLFKEEGEYTFIKNLDFEMVLSDNSNRNAYEYFFNNNFIENIYYFDNVSILDLYLATNFDAKRSIVNHTDEFINELFKVFKDNVDNTDESAEVILKKIENIIGGKYSSKLLPMFHSDKIDTTSLVRSRPEKVTTTSSTPSGIKQMGIIQMLLLNHKLNKGDYLIIDEPEVNLHPDWQFKFAEILVLLAKELDVTIYINSHSPLLIESIAAFSEFYDMSEEVNYYLTEPSEDEGKYDFVKITSDELYKVYDNLGNAYDLIDQLRLKKRLGE